MTSEILSGEDDNNFPTRRCKTSEARAVQIKSHEDKVTQEPYFEMNKNKDLAIPKYPQKDKYKPATFMKYRGCGIEKF